MTFSIDVATSASVQTDSEPTDPTVAATVLVSLWQRNLIGLKVERFCNWQLASADAVAYLSGVNYAAA